MKPPLKLPLALHEACVEQYRARDRATGELTPDDAIDALHSALASARADAERIAALHEALINDPTITVGAAALKVRNEALKLGEKASAKLDKARARAQKAIDAIRASTHAPAVPKDALAMQLESEIRARMALMPDKDRSGLLANAIAADNELIVGACLRGPAMLCGLTEAELNVRRTMWRQKKFPSEFGREQHLQKAIEALDRGGQSFFELPRNRH